MNSQRFCRTGGGRNLRSLAFVCFGILILSLTGCGGGGSSSTPTPQNPVPSITSISPLSAYAGGVPFTLTVNGSNFISGSVVQWGAAGRTTTFVSSTQLTAAIPAADLSNAGTVAITVHNPTPGGGTSSALFFTVKAVTPLAVASSILPDAQNSKTYSYPLAASGGIAPYSWSLNGGALPTGLSLSSGGVISGTPPAVTSNTAFSFLVRVTDSAFQPTAVTKSLSILVRALPLGRNDTCATATPITNGTFRASISPYGDVDVYSFQGTVGQQVSIEIFANRLAIYPNSTSIDVFLDSFLELLDSNCSMITFNDDVSSGILDSAITNYTLPYTGTYYIRVSDLRGDGRPDFIYELDLSGAN